MHDCRIVAGGRSRPGNQVKRSGRFRAEGKGPKPCREWLAQGRPRIRIGRIEEAAPDARRIGHDTRDGVRGEKGERGAEGRPGRDLTQMGPDGKKW